MTAHAFPADRTLEALRVQRGAYAASGGEAAVSYDKLRDELAIAKQRLSDQEEMLRAAKRGRPKTTAAHGGPREAGAAAEAKL
jgi:hypothetical protein